MEHFALGRACWGLETGWQKEACAFPAVGLRSQADGSQGGWQISLAPLLLQYLPLSSHPFSALFLSISSLPRSSLILTQILSHLDLINFSVLCVSGMLARCTHFLVGHDTCCILERVNSRTTHKTLPTRRRKIAPSTSGGG